MKYRHVVCVVDGSRESARAQEKAAEVASENQSKLTYVFLADTHFLEKMATLTRGGHALEAGMENIGRVLLAKAHEVAGSKGVKSEEEVLTGVEGETLVSELQELKADLLVTHLEQGSFLFNVDRSDLEDTIHEVKNRTGVEILLF